MLDAIDLQILEKLQHQPQSTEDAPPKAAFITHAEIARQINAVPPPERRISDSTVTRRIEALEKAGIIKHYNATLDAKKLGLEYCAYVRVYFRTYRLKQLDAFWEKVVALPYVQAASVVTGERTDVLLRVITTNSEAYYEIFKEIHALAGGAMRVETSQILKEFKRTTALPLDHLRPAPVTPRHHNSMSKTPAPANDNSPMPITLAEIS